MNRLKLSIFQSSTTLLTHHAARTSRRPGPERRERDAVPVEAEEPRSLPAGRAHAEAGSNVSPRRTYALASTER